MNKYLTSLLLIGALESSISAQTLSREELEILKRDSITYSGTKEFTVYIRHAKWKITNYNTFIAHKGVQPLERIVNEITAGAKTTEEKIQSIVTWVNKNIGYTYYDEKNHSAGYPDSLITLYKIFSSGKADCVGLTIAGLSMINQLDGVNCRLTYLKKHLAPAVQGNFAKDNRLYFVIDRDTFFYAELTVKDFQIGSTRLKQAHKYKPEQIQKLEDNSLAYDMRLQKLVEGYDAKKKSMNEHNIDYGRKEK